MSSTHEGVSCDTCMKNNFSGRRYKCLVCYDFDLCSTCYEAGAKNTQHLATHPMQCILTRADYDVYYGGESNIEPQSFTCPYCGKLGFTEITLSEHVTIEHEDENHEVVCPICAAIPTGDPNHLTEDLLNHINLEHRNIRDNNWNDDRTYNRYSRVIGSRTNTSRRGGRNTFQFGSTGSGTLPSLIGRDGMDPIAELLSQLSGVRRAVAQTSTLQLQQLQAHLREREKEHLQQTRQSNSIFSNQSKSTKTITSTNSSSNNNNNNNNNSSTSSNNNNNQSTINNSNNNNNTTNINNNNFINSQINPLITQVLELPNIFETLNMNRDSRFLLSRYDNTNNKSTNSQSTKEQQQQQQQNTPISINQSFFIHDVLLSTLMNNQVDNINFNLNENINTNDSSNNNESKNNNIEMNSTKLNTTNEY